MKRKRAALPLSAPGVANAVLQLWYALVQLLHVLHHHTGYVCVEDALVASPLHHVRLQL